MRERVAVPAVRDKEMRAILDRYGLSAPLDSGKLLCPCCSTTLTWENVGGLLIVEGEPRFFCSGSDCLNGIREEAQHG